MRIICLSLLVFAITSAISQTPTNKTIKPVKTEMPSRTEMQSQMNDATNEIRKEIADLEKQIGSSGDEEEIKDLKEQVAMLKKQLSMMEGLNKNVAGMSDKVFQEAANEDTGTVIPKRDETRISIIPKKILSDAELLSFLKNTHAGVEKLIPAAERSEALNIYLETKTKYKSSAIVANAANGCWMLGHWEKALYIIGKACIDDVSDADNLNNYASFLIMAGAEQAAIPILEYLNLKYPENSTIKNNIGQAWFGLGDLQNAKKNLMEATGLYSNHSPANATLSSIYESEGDNQKAISFLKASIKENYDPDKEAQLLKLGVELTFDDLPPLNYPMQKDPFGLIPIINLIPEEYQSNLDDRQKVYAIKKNLNGIGHIIKELEAKQVVLTEKGKERKKKKATDASFRNETLEPYNSPAYKLATRGLQLIHKEKSGSSAGRSQSLGKVMTVDEILAECSKLYDREVKDRLVELFAARTNNPAQNCAEVDAIQNAYLQKAADIRRRGIQLIKRRFVEKSELLDNYIKYWFYTLTDDPPTNAEDMTYTLVSNDKIFSKSHQFVAYLSLFNLGRSFTDDNGVVVHCDEQQPQVVDPGSDDLAPLVREEVKCEFYKLFKTPVSKFGLICKTIVYDPASKLKNRKGNVPKGSARNGARASSMQTGPLGCNLKGGPLPTLSGMITPEQMNAPLTGEKQDQSQVYLEYDRWGNLVGLNFQLNDDGLALQDPDSIQSGVESRWSWNAIASPRKGYLNKLLIK